MLIRKVMAEQPVADVMLIAVAVVLQQEADAAAEGLRMMQETLEMLVEREDVEAVTAESLALRRIQAIGASSSRTTTT